MASNTPNLNLLKKDPIVDRNDTFNIQTMLNDNWDKIDAAMGDIDIPEASLNVKGKVQLSSALNSDAENLAVTPKAVKAAYDAGIAAQVTANAANAAAGVAQTKANAAETPTGAQAKVNASVGNLASLQTTAKGNAVAAINELFTSASNGKTQVAAAITGKGVPASGSDTFAQLANKIGQILAKQKGTSTINFNESTLQITSTSRVVKEILTLPKAVSYFRFIDTDSSYIRSGYNSDNSVYAIPTISLMDANNNLIDLFSVASGVSSIKDFYIIFAESTIVLPNGHNTIAGLSTAPGPFKIVYTYRQNQLTSNYPWSYILLRGILSYE
ncbi:tail fiber protein [Paenibacillus senegalimassiliensis]|uniref:tail fiber protein n=1 Tax=Paenibacillus senegalimassiliensis TaxID=1737426 RepID=UPI00073EE7E6|nr:phage tail protein [Paenibacillus senegalimassiliensis]